MSIASYGQIKDTIIKIGNEKVILDYDSRLNKSELKKYIENFKKDYIKEHDTKTSNSIKNILGSIPLSSDACVNGGFENDIIAWTGLSLKHGATSLPIENGLITNPGILPFSQIHNSNSGGNYINIESPGNDPLLISATPSVTLPKVISGNKSIRLGNDSPGFGSEGIAKRFVVTPQNAKYYFQYAIIMDRSHSNPDGTPNGSEVFFIAEATDMNGNTIDKIVDIGNPSNPFIQSVNNGSTYYRNWHCAYLDLSSKIGQEVVVMFINADCSAGAHKGYTYLDAVCEECVNTSEGNININLTSDNCMQFPQPISGTFTLPANGNATNQNISLGIYQNNTLVNTINNPQISGNNYTFNLSASDFPNQNIGQCYDLVATLSFQMPDMNGNLQTVTQTSSTVVNGVQDGETPGLDNDVCFCKTEPNCCNIPGKVSIKLNKALSLQNNAFQLQINGIITPLQNIEVSMADYHVVYNNKACQPQNMGVFGNLSSTMSTAGNLILVGNHTHSLNWELGSPTAFNGNIPIQIGVPDIVKLSCCSGKYYFCLKVKITDVNCNVCEKMVCGEINLKTKHIIQANPLPSKK
ncbi:MAG TPA: hypothetical protein ENK64_00970 [Flavobacteriales bacterium]|nr:hypothetical protein [Flavobacteriales bacterium]